MINGDDKKATIGPGAYFLEEEHNRAAEEAKKRYEELRGCEYALPASGCPAYRMSLSIPRDKRPIFYDTFPCNDKVKCQGCGVHKMIEENKEYRKKYLASCFDADDL